MALKASVEELKQKSGGDSAIKASGFNYVSWQQRWQTVTCIASLFLRSCLLSFLFFFFAPALFLFPHLYYWRDITHHSSNRVLLHCPLEELWIFLKDMKLGLDLDQRTIWWAVSTKVQQISRITSVFFLTPAQVDSFRAWTSRGCWSSSSLSWMELGQPTGNFNFSCVRGLSDFALITKISKNALYGQRRCEQKLWFYNTFDYIWSEPRFFFLLFLSGYFDEKTLLTCLVM